LYILLDAPTNDSEAAVIVMATVTVPTNPNVLGWSAEGPQIESETSLPVVAVEISTISIMESNSTLELETGVVSPMLQSDGNISATEHATTITGPANHTDDVIVPVTSLSADDNYAEVMMKKVTSKDLTETETDGKDNVTDIALTTLTTDVISVKELANPSLNGISSQMDSITGVTNSVLADQVNITELAIPDTQLTEHNGNSTPVAMTSQFNNGVIYTTENTMLGEKPGRPTDYTGLITSGTADLTIAAFEDSQLTPDPVETSSELNNISNSTTASVHLQNDHVPGEQQILANISTMFCFLHVDLIFDKSFLDIGVGISLLSYLQ